MQETSFGKIKLNIYCKSDQYCIKKGENPMKNKFGIGLFVLSFVLLYLLAGKAISYQNENNKNNENALLEESVQADGQASQKECYYLYDVNGYIVVYLSDKKTPYEYTDVLVEELPEITRKEIRNGKYIDNIEELYGFLENYSS